MQYCNHWKILRKAFLLMLLSVRSDDSQSAVHGDCMKSLYGMWYDYMFHRNTNEKAYRATMKYLKRKPRSKNVPYWTSITELSRQGDSYGEWLKKATYYDNADFLSTMVDLVLDPAANHLARSQAIKVIAKIGTKEDLEKLKTAVQALTDDKEQERMVSDIDRALK